MPETHGWQSDQSGKPGKQAGQRQAAKTEAMEEPIDSLRRRRTDLPSRRMYRGQPCRIEREPLTPACRQQQPGATHRNQQGHRIEQRGQNGQLRNISFQ